MKLRVVFAVASIAAVLAALPARADEHGKRGDYDEHRNGSRSITRIGSHGMTTGKITIMGMVIETHPARRKSEPVDCRALI